MSDDRETESDVSPEFVITFHEVLDGSIDGHNAARAASVVAMHTDQLARQCRVGSVKVRRDDDGSLANASRNTRNGEKRRGWLEESISDHLSAAVRLPLTDESEYALKIQTEEKRLEKRIKKAEKQLNMIRKRQRESGYVFGPHARDFPLI